MTNASIDSYHAALDAGDQVLCGALRQAIDAGLTGAEARVWHGHPVWFLGANPIVGYSRQKAGIRLMFWSGADFDEPGLVPGTGKFKDASVVYTAPDQIIGADLARWLDKARRIQWDYANIVRRKGRLERLAPEASV